MARATERLSRILAIMPIRTDLMTVEFTPITLKSQDEYLARLKEVPLLTSDYSFANLWAWCDEYRLSWAWSDNLVWIRQDDPAPMYWAPMGAWDSIDWQTELGALPEKLDFCRVPEPLARLWKRLSIPLDRLETREHWDYVYSVKQLIHLRGNKFHNKKNLLQQFYSSYDWEYVALDGKIIRQALLMQLDWCAWKNCEASAGLAAEDRVITKVLKSFGELRNLFGGALIVDHMVIAFTVAESLSDDTLVIHFEKGMNGYKGVYQAINREFLATHKEFIHVNREQDLGNEGLRKAKLSYNPTSLLKKYELHWR